MIEQRKRIIMMIFELFRLAASIMFTPISDEVLLLAQLSIWVSKDMNPYLAWISSWFAIFIAFLWFYLVGRFFRELPLVERWMAKKWLLKAEHSLQRFGIWAVMAAFFIPGIRHPVHYMAGILKFPIRKYLLANLIASSLYTGFWTFMVYKLGQKIEMKFILIWFHQHLFIVLSLCVFMILCLIFYKWKNK
jgi:membrane protein DedA with SNARE-associated domain